MRNFHVHPSRRVFVDTSAYFAMTDPDDEHHALAVAISVAIARQHRQPVTTNFVVAEAHGLVLSRIDRETAAQLVAEIDKSSTLVVRVAARDEDRARDIIQQYDDKDFSLTDAMSFAVMERLRIPSAFTFDQHFAQFGFALVEPGQT